MISALATSPALGGLNLTWDRLHDLPDAVGFAGHFAGVHGGALIVAGGSNFPEAPLWEKGPKVWHDRIFVLTDPEGEWVEAGHLPRPLASGVAVSTPQGVFCIGGGDKDRHYRETFLLQWEEDRIRIVEYPPLPQALASAAGARVGSVIYLAGGQAEPTGAQASSLFLSFDLSAPEKGWQELETWPGPERMLAVAATDGDAFYLISGIQLRPGETAKERLGYLRDAYVYRPREGWQRLPDLPHPAAAAPSPSICLGSGSPVVFGGVDGEQLGIDPRRHPGLPATILRLDPRAGEWQEIGRTPAARVALPAVEWRDSVVFPSGELSPGIRSPQVWRLAIGGEGK
jgi:N-acetylneuraminate epimerase